MQCKGAGDEDGENNTSLLCWKRSSLNVVYGASELYLEIANQCAYRPDGPVLLILLKASNFHPFLLASWQ